MKSVYTLYITVSVNAPRAFCLRFLKISRCVSYRELYGDTYCIVRQAYRCSPNGKTYLLPFKYSYSRYKKRKNQHVFNVFTQVGVKQLTAFLPTVTAASNLVDCTLVNCENQNSLLVSGEKPK